MHVVHVASEVAPYAKTGGLGDVLAALPATLARGGTDVTVVIPGHRAAHRTAAGLRRVASVGAPVSTRTEPATVLAVEGAPVPTMLIDAPRYFDRPGLYGEDGQDYPDSAERFVVFCRAALEWLRTWTRPPDVVHVHDWQAALIPAFLVAGRDLYPELQGTPTVMTVHNLAYQGRFSAADWHLLNLDRRLFQPEALEFYGSINMLKAGLVFADAISTVSPRYAKEICTAAMGEGLDGVLRSRGPALHGILNGVDYTVWDPATDAALAAPYDRTNRAGKARCKAALAAELGLDVAPDVPIIAMVSRLAHQKGVDLVIDVAPSLLDAGVMHLVVLGSGDPQLEAQLLGLARRYPRRMAVRVGFDDGLAHRIEAGADAFLMPSRFEPCGLSQLYSLRYGAVPIVHATGGLFDTVLDYDPALGTGTGFVFSPFGRDAFLRTIQRALQVWRTPERWRGIISRGMAADFSWDLAAASYRQLYEELRGRPPRAA